MSQQQVHDRAVAFMRANPGTTYEAAMMWAGGRLPDHEHKPDPVAIEFMLANPGSSGEEAIAYSRFAASSEPPQVQTYSAAHQPTALHERAMRIMRETPGLTYDDAEAKARGR